MSFCGKCGTSIPEGSKFCPECGNPVAPQATAYQNGTGNEGATAAPDSRTSASSSQPYGNQASTGYTNSYGNTYTNSYANSYGNPNSHTYGNPYGSAPNPSGGSAYQPGKKGPGKLIFILIAAAAAVAVILLVLFATGVIGGKKVTSYEEPIYTLTQALKKQDADMLLSIFPKEFINSQMDYYEDEDELTEELAEYLFSEFEDYRIKDVTYEVTDKYHLDSSDIEDLIDDYYYYLDTDVNVTDAYELDVDLTLRTSEGVESDSASLTVIKVNGKWYLDPFNF